MPASTPAAHRDRKVDGDSGFTLTETLVSITLLVLTGGAATTGVVGGLRAQSDNEMRTTASNLVRADVDDARSVLYPDYPPPVARHPEKVGAKTFWLTRTVTARGVVGTATCPDVITATGVLALTVTSTVTWADRDDTRSITMTTVVSC
ncbi:PulJ/GspJ family protein [Jatrophihabitans sp. YIM 134969]